MVKEDEDVDAKDHKHTYKQIDPDGTAECTKCGLRNSDPSKTGESKLNESTEDGSQYHIDQIDDDLMNGEFDSYEDVVGYLDNIIKGIEGLKIQQKQVFQDIENDDYGYGRLRGEMESEEFKDEYQARLDKLNSRGSE